jgi:hypothetical protein
MMHFGRLESSSKSAERVNVKASVRKQVQELLEKAPATPELKRLQEEYRRKGTLSKREIKILLGQKAPPDQLENVA